MKKKQEGEQVCCADPGVGDLFIFYVNAKVTPTERRRIEEHLEGCNECREELRFFRELKMAAKELFADI